jgi:hypothetical protein
MHACDDEISAFQRAVRTDVHCAAETFDDVLGVVQLGVWIRVG